MSTHSLTQPMPEKQPLAVVVVHPRAFRQPKQPANDRRGLRELADVCSLHLYGCIADCLTTEEREDFLLATGRYLAEIENRKGRAS